MVTLDILGHALLYPLIIMSTAFVGTVLFATGGQKLHRVALASKGFVKQVFITASLSTQFN